MGDGGAEGSSATGDGGQAAISLMPDVDGTGSGLQLEGSKVGDLLYVFFICVVECLHIMVYQIHFFSHSAMSSSLN